MDAHDEALDEMRALLDADPASSSARAAFRALEREKPLKLLTVCVDAETAIWAEDSVTATKLVAKPSNLLLKITAAARAGDWEEIVMSSYMVFSIRSRSPAELPYVRMWRCQ